MSKIGPSDQKTKKIPYGDRIINDFWLRLKEKANDTPPGTSSARKEIIALLNSTRNSLICIQTETMSDKEIVKAVFDAQDRGNRTYVMTNDFNSAMQSLRGRCLIRYGLKNIGSFVLINPNTNAPRAVLYTGPFSEGALAMNENLLFDDIDGEQCPVLYGHFCFHFWNSAEKEIIGGEEKNCGKGPIGIYPPSNNFCDSEYVKKELLSLPDGSNIITVSINNNTYLNFTNLRKTTIITSLAEKNVNMIKEAGNSIYSCEKEVSVNIIDAADCGAWIIPKDNIANDDIFFALKANEKQVSRMKALFAEYLNCADYKYFDSDKRENLSGKYIRTMDGKDIEIKRLTLKDLGDNNTGKALLSYGEFEKSEPAEFPDSDDAVETEYIWRNIPFYLPQNCTKHKLYEQWDVETKKIIDRLDSIAKKIDDTEKKETSISSRIKDLLRSIKINFNRQKDKIGTLKAESEHFRFLENGELKDRIKRINEIYKEVDSSVANFEEDDRKAKLDDDIDKLQIEIGDKEKNQKEKEENLAREKEENPKRIEVFCAEFIKQKKAEIEARLENLREEISSIENETEKAKKIEQKKRDEFAVNNLSIDYSTNQKGLNKIKGDLDKKAGKDQRGKDPDTAEQADVLLRDFKNIKESDLFISTTEKEIDAIKIEIKTIENNIAQKEKEKNKINSTSQSTKGSALYNVLSNIKQDKNKPADKPEQKEGLSVPSYPHLPKTGTLHQGDGKNYLSINDWDEFEEAQKEAKRLDAILCAERG